MIPHFGAWKTKMGGVEKGVEVVIRSSVLNKLNEIHVEVK